MRIIDDTFIIGIDSGYGNIKTANCCFPASVAAYDTEPVFKDNMLVYGNRFYLIGEGHKEFLADKTRDNDYYVLALAAIAREMNIFRSLTSSLNGWKRRTRSILRSNTTGRTTPAVQRH